MIMTKGLFTKLFVLVITLNSLAWGVDACEACESSAGAPGQSMLQVRHETIPVNANSNPSLSLSFVHSATQLSRSKPASDRAKLSQTEYHSVFAASDQARAEMLASHASGAVGSVQREAVGECELPSGAVWCQVLLNNLPPFWMAVYDWSVKEDWVSYNICQTGHWEHVDFHEFGPSGHMLDIGGNIGYMTFSFAQAGWTVTTFEPMPPNLLLMGATLCRNPQFQGSVEVNWFGLGTSNQHCKMIAPKDNVGDGFTRCADTASITPVQQGENTWDEKGTFSMRRLDEVLLEQGIFKVDLVKIDVEGYEAQVFLGAPNFLSQYQPRLIKSEVWGNVVGSSGSAYLKRFKDAGYNFFEDSKCQVPMDALLVVISKKFADVFMCNSYGVNGAELAKVAKQAEAERFAAEAATAAEIAKKQNAALVDMAGDWDQATDPASGKVYYFKRGSRETTWDAPPSLWDQATDPASGQVYYFNRVTRETTWTRPS